jgi:hypothetical protein
MYSSHQLVAPQPKVVLNKNHIIQQFFLQTVPLVGVYMLKNTPIAFTKLTTKLLTPIGYNKT